MPNSFNVNTAITLTIPSNNSYSLAAESKNNMKACSNICEPVSDVHSSDASH